MSENSNSIYLVSLVNWLKITLFFLLSKWLKLFIVATIFALLGITYAWLQIPQYKAKLSFSFESGSGESGSLSSYAGIAAQLGFDIGGMSTGSAYMGDNLMEFLKTRLIVEKTLFTKTQYNSSSLFIDEYIKNHELNKGWNEKELFKNIKFYVNEPPDRIKDSVISKIYDNIVKKQLSIEKVDKKLSYVNITFSDNNEEFAKYFTEALINTASTNYTIYKTEKSKKNLDLIMSQIDSVKGVLYDGINGVASSTDLNVNPNKAVIRTGIQKKQIDVQTASVVYGELLKNMEIAKLTLQRETPLVQIIDKPVFPLEKKKMGRLLGGIIFALIGTMLFSVYLVVFKMKNKTA